MIASIASRIASLYSVSAIRSKDSSKPFNLDEFKRLDSLDSIESYAEARLFRLGQGEARTVYALSSRDVLKVARSSKGIDQNSLEVSTYWNNIRYASQMAHINESHPDHFWLIAELTRPLTQSDVEEGGPYHDRYLAIWATINEIRKVYWIDSSTYTGENSPDLFTGERAHLRDFVRNMLKQGHPPTEIGKLDSWGRTTTGRMVCLDYGADLDYFDRYH